MMVLETAIIATVASLLIAAIALYLRGRSRIAIALSSAGLLTVAVWWLADDTPPATNDLPSGPSTSFTAAVTSSDCADCHRAEYDSWRRTYHRTMTRDATPENVKGDFANAIYDYQGIETRLTHSATSFSWKRSIRIGPAYMLMESI